MIYFDLTLNLALLVALSAVSGFIEKRRHQNVRLVVLLQGALFGCVTIIGMLRPMVLGPGLIFDGRSVMISLCALFFGPWAVSVTCMMTIACRVALGGVGTFMGVSVILSSAIIGLAAYYRFKPSLQPPSMLRLYGLGLTVHLVMVALMFTLPEGMGLTTFKHLGLPVVLLYPFATILAGKILADQLSNIQSVEALRESEERYRLLFDVSLDAILLTSSDGVIVAVNPAACGLFGRTEEDLIGSGRNIVVDTADPRLPSALEERNRTGKFNGELTFIRKDGSKFEGEISSSAFLNREGNARNGTIIRGITERKKAEEILRTSEERFRRIFQYSASGMVLVSSDLYFIQVNNAFCKMLGYSEAELLKKTFQDVTLPEDRPVGGELVRETLSGEREMFELEKRYQHKNGAVVWGLVSSTLIRDAGNKPLHFVSQIQDITERKQAEERIRKFNEELEQKIKERTTDLRETIARLEEVNRVFVDRELRMTELKERIAELEKK